MRKDTSPRTKVIKRYNYAFIGSLLLLIMGICLFINGDITYNSMVNRSSSPIGTEMVFRRSGAHVSVNGIYTDEAQSVLIVRLHTADADTLKLPYKGSDFKVYIGADCLNDSVGKEISVLFGRYSTDGDLFLVIPRPTHDIYNVFLMNENFVATNNLGDKEQKKNNNKSTAAPVASTGANQSDEKIQAQLAKSLNDYEYTDVASRGKSIAVAGDQSDMIGFRVTLNPALNNDDYRAKVIPGMLLSEDGTFDFEQFFNNVFKTSATNSMQAQYDTLSQQRDLYQARVTELNERLKENPNDDAAATLLKSVNQKLDETNTSLVQLAKSYDEVEGVQYKESMFKNMQTEATVFPTSKSEAFSKLVAQG